MREVVVIVSCVSRIQEMSAFRFPIVVMIPELLLRGPASSTFVETIVILLRASSRLMFVVSVWLHFVSGSWLFALRRRGGGFLLYLLSLFPSAVIECFLRYSWILSLCCFVALGFSVLPIAFLSFSFRRYCVYVCL